MSDRKVMIVWPGGQKYPFQGDMPQVGAVIAGFIVRKVSDYAVDLHAPETPEEQEAAERWEQERRKR